MKCAIVTVLRILALTILLFILFAVGGTMIGAPQGPEPTDEGTAALLLLAACLLNVLVITFIVRKSVIFGWKLVITLLLSFYGIMTFMSQIEAAVFPTQMSSEMVWKVFAMGIIITAPFSLVAVPLLGRWREASKGAEPLIASFGLAGWMWRLSLIACVYVIIYFVFGYFVAWQFSAVREYYGGGELQGFFSHLSAVVSDSTWLIGFQLLRGLIWAVLGLLIVKIVGNRKLAAPLAVGLAFAVLMNSQLLLPNPFMPEAVRMAHLLETASSNFLFGCFAGWMLMNRSSARYEEDRL